MNNRANRSKINSFLTLPRVLGMLLALGILAGVLAPGLGMAEPSRTERLCYVIAAIERSPAAGVDSAMRECGNPHLPHIVTEQPAPTRAPLAAR